MNKIELKIPGGNWKVPDFLSVKNRLSINLAVTIVAVFGFFFLLRDKVSGGQLMIDESNSVTVLTFLLALVIALAGWYFGIHRGVKTEFLAFVLIAVGMSLYTRLSFFDFASPDYNSFLSGLVDQTGSIYGVNDGNMNAADYNAPLLFILSLVAKSGQPSLYMVKSFSVLFDYVLAFYVMKLASIRFPSTKRQIAIFCVMLFMPTVMLNSALWGQCDAVYAAICVAAVYYGMTNRSKTSVVLFALSFSFKLQTIFILPILAVFLFTKRVKWAHLSYFVVALFPEILSGKAVEDTFSAYSALFNPIEGFSRLSFDAPNIYMLLGEKAPSIFGVLNSAGIAFTCVVVFVGLFYFWRKRKLLNERATITAAFIFVLLMPFMLPQMHERYFFLADIFSLFMFIYNPKRWMVPLFVSYVSVRSYLPFMLGSSANYLFLFIILLVILGVTVYDMYAEVRQEEKKIQIHYTEEGALQ